MKRVPKALGGKGSRDRGRANPGRVREADHARRGGRPTELKKRKSQTKVRGREFVDQWTEEVEAGSFRGVRS